MGRMTWGTGRSGRRVRVILTTFALCLSALLNLAPLAQGATNIHGAEQKTADKANADIRRKIEEIERLKAELLQAEEELRILQHGIEQVASALSATVSEPASSLLMVGDLPPLSPETIVTGNELSAQFRADPAMAHSRYHNKTFLIEGSVTRFEPKFARRNYDLVFEPAERSPAIIGRFAYLDGYRAVYTRENGQVLVARIGEHEESFLFRIGDRIRIRARCGGIRDGAIHFTRCSIVVD